MWFEGKFLVRIVHEKDLAQGCGSTRGETFDMVHVYPTMAEALKIVALSFIKDVTKMSRCAE